MNTFVRLLTLRLFIASLAVLIGCQSPQPSTQSAPKSGALDQIDVVLAHKLLRSAISQYRTDGIEVPRDNFNEINSETIRLPSLLLPLVEATNMRQLLSSKEFGRSLDMEERQLAWLCWRINGNQGISIRIDPPSNEQTKWVVIEITLIQHVVVHQDVHWQTGETVTPKPDSIFQCWEAWDVKDGEIYLTDLQGGKDVGNNKDSWYMKRTIEM